MAANTSPIFLKDVQVAAATIVNASSTTAVTIVTADATNGSRCLSLIASNDATAALAVDLFVTVSSTDYRIGIGSIPAAAGTGSTANVNLLDATKIPGLQPDGSLLLGAGHILKIAAQTAIASGKTATIVAQYGNY